MTTPSWTFLTNHTHVLICLQRDPDLRVRELALQVGITERAVLRIISELTEAGYLEIHKDGRRNHYRIKGNRPLRHPVESKHKLVGVLNALA
ncbi:MAG: winged helix-turn-helix domain-containing protein [Planctomycetota bacterium]|jgi:predicted transcriptional regulator|nr:winged helix-turn-helix domain-containing protein [Planctomycetota bacterium]